MSFDQLAGHPLAVATKYPFNIISPSGGSSVMVADRTGLLGAHRLQSSKVSRGTRILGVQMKLDTSGIIDFTIGAPKTGGETCFWLPWDSDHVYRTKLPDGGGGQPRFFFTAHLTGCSVFIETNNGKTHVYHANAQSTGDYEGATALARATYLPGHANVRDHKADTMRSRFEQVRKDRGGEYAEANAADYLKSPMFERPKHFQPRVNKLARRHANLGRKLLGSGRYIRNAKFDVSYGVVFGVWRDGRWQFFQQSVVEISYQHRDKVRSAWTDRYAAVMVEDCKRIT